MEMRHTSPLRFFPFLAGGLLLCLWNPGALPAAIPETKPIDYELSLTPDPESRNGSSFIIKLKKISVSDGFEDIGEVMVWWTTPNGRRSSFPIRPFSDRIWVSRVALASEPGINRLNVMILGRNRDGSLDKTIELSYTLEMPGAKLARLAQKEPDAERKKEALSQAPVPREKSAPSKKRDISVPVIVLLVVFANLLLLVPGLLFHRLFRRISPAVRRRGPVLPQAGPVLNSSCGNLLASAGLIDRRSGGPLAWDCEKTGNAEGVAPAFHKEAFEETMIDPGPGEDGSNTLGEKCTIDKIKSLSTEQLVEMIGDAIEQLEQGQVSNDLKELIKTAERELAYREQAKENEKAADKKESTDVRIGRAAGGQGETEKINLNDLSF